MFNQHQQVYQYAEKCAANPQLSSPLSTNQIEQSDYGNENPVSNEIPENENTTNSPESLLGKLRRAFGIGETRTQNQVKYYFNFWLYNWLGLMRKTVLKKH